MGGFRKYNPEGGFSEYLYHQVEKAVTAGGITAKVVIRIDDDSFHSSLPLYANTSQAYAKRSDEGGHEVEQLRIYKDRKAYLDFDWGHGHGRCVSGVVHVHVSSGDGHLHSDARGVRYMNNEEMTKYGALIKKLNPHAKLRPTRR